MELKQGTILQQGKYRIEKKLGQGSFGITYLATTKFSTQTALGKMDVVAKVAIKEFFMSEINTRNKDGSTVEGSMGNVFANYRRKFKKEALNLSQLNHPNIVRVFDVFDENGTTYYAMLYVDGGNLDEYINQHNPIKEDEAIEIIAKICQALAYMHEQHMLHLDLKPKNIMRSSTGNIYLIDFGLSKQFNDNGEPESSTTIGLGTPGYAPLEQAKFIQDGAFPATLDIYALGATMYKILTGRRPADASDILNDGFQSDSLIKWNRSRNLIEVVEKCMAPIKRNRFQTVNDIYSRYPKFKDICRPTVNRAKNSSQDSKPITLSNILYALRDSKTKHTNTF
jgi:serine/threonine protein kinase